MTRSVVKINYPKLFYFRLTGVRQPNADYNSRVRYRDCSRYERAPFVLKDIASHIGAGVEGGLFL